MSSPELEPYMNAKQMLAPKAIASATSSSVAVPAEAPGDAGSIGERASGPDTYSSGNDYMLEEDDEWKEQAKDLIRLEDSESESEFVAEAVEPRQNQSFCEETDEQKKLRTVTQFFSPIVQHLQQQQRLVNNVVPQAGGAFAVVRSHKLSIPSQERNTGAASQSSDIFGQLGGALGSVRAIAAGLQEQRPLPPGALSSPSYASNASSGIVPAAVPTLPQWNSQAPPVSPMFAPHLSSSSSVSMQIGTPSIEQCAPQRSREAQTPQNVYSLALALPENESRIEASCGVSGSGSLGRANVSGTERGGGGYTCAGHPGRPIANPSVHLRLCTLCWAFFCSDCSKEGAHREHDNVPFNLALAKVRETIQAKRASVLETTLYLRDLHAERVRRATDSGRDTGPHIAALIANVDRAIAALNRERKELADDLAPRLAAAFEKCARPPTQELECRLSRAERLVLQLDDCENLLKVSASATVPTPPTSKSTAASSSSELAALAEKSAFANGTDAPAGALPATGGQQKARTPDLNEAVRALREMAPAFSEMLDFRVKTECTYFTPSLMFDGSIAASKGQVLDGLRKLLEACTLEDLRASIEEHEHLCASVCNDDMLERLAAEFRFPPPSAGPEAADAPRAKRTTFYTNERQVKRKVETLVSGAALQRIEEKLQNEQLSDSRSVARFAYNAARDELAFIDLARMQVRCVSRPASALRGYCGAKGKEKDVRAAAKAFEHALLTRAQIPTDIGIGNGQRLGSGVGARIVEGDLCWAGDELLALVALHERPCPRSFTQLYLFAEATTGGEPGRLAAAGTTADSSRGASSFLELVHQMELADEAIASFSWSRAFVTSFPDSKSGAMGKSVKIVVAFEGSSALYELKANSSAPDSQMELRGSRAGAPKGLLRHASLRQSTLMREPLILDRERDRPQVELCPPTRRRLHRPVAAFAYWSRMHVFGVAFKDGSLFLYDAASWVPLMDLSAELATLVSSDSGYERRLLPVKALLFTSRTAGLFLTSYREVGGWQLLYMDLLTHELTAIATDKEVDRLEWCTPPTSRDNANAMDFLLVHENMLNELMRFTWKFRKNH